MNDPYRLERFVSAQEGIYERALAELRAGSKRSHWMWFVFPQIDGLGSSEMARRYAIESTEEARAYLAHPVLGPRLLACLDAFLGHRGTSAEMILGSVDATKLRSSLTLFREAKPGESRFQLGLEAFFDGAGDRRTLELLEDRRSRL